MLGSINPGTSVFRRKDRQMKLRDKRAANEAAHTARDRKARRTARERKARGKGRAASLGQYESPELIVLRGRQ
jgi:hypothetical protein